MKKSGFTLAEILITIGIIGVVAALTIPLLIQNSNSKKFTTQFKKSLSTLNQAAISAQAQYDLDYSLLSQVNEDSTCKSDTLASGQYTLCGLFNNTLAGQTYLGKYGNVKAANNSGSYSASVSSFDISDFLFFSFSDGAFVAFNPNAKGCGVGVGNVITTDMLSDKLANCLGFIDVNGPTPPNKEVQCAEGTTTLSVNTTCKVTNGSMGDIFPIVFHDGAVEPATNASLAAFLGGNGKENTSATGDSGAGSASAPKKITYKGQEYELKNDAGRYYREDENGNLIDTEGKIYTKNADGNYEYNRGSYADVFDKDMKSIGRKYNNGIYATYNNGMYYREDENGNYLANGGPYIKNTDGNYVASDGTIYSKDFEAKYINGQWYKYKSGGNNLLNYYREDSNGNLIDTYGVVYTKNNDGTYQNGSRIYNGNIGILGNITSNGDFYKYTGQGYVKQDTNGNYVDFYGNTIFTKNSEGYYESKGKLFDEDLIEIGPI